jgi:hypothetical protein
MLLSLLAGSYVLLSLVCAFVCYCACATGALTDKAYEFAPVVNQSPKRTKGQLRRDMLR